MVCFFRPPCILLAGCMFVVVISSSAFDCVVWRDLLDFQFGFTVCEKSHFSETNAELCGEKRKGCLNWLAAFAMHKTMWVDKFVTLPTNFMRFVRENNRDTPMEWPVCWYVVTTIMIRPNTLNVGKCAVPDNFNYVTRSKAEEQKLEALIYRVVNRFYCIHGNAV